MFDYPVGVVSILLIFIVFVCAFGASRAQKWRVRASQKVISKIEAIPDAARQFAYLRKVDPFVFEEMILSSLKHAGFRIKRNKKYTGDGGIDGRFYINNQLWLVQAKRYSGYINPAHVRKFEEICLKLGAHGLFVHTGKTGGGSWESCGKRAVIVSGKKMLDLVSGNRARVIEALGPGVFSK